MRTWANLTKRSRYSGAPHPCLAGVLNDMAQIHISQRRFAQAEPLVRRAIAIWESAAVPEQPNLAVGLNNLAQTLRFQGISVEAEPLYRRSLQILEKRLGAEHPDFNKELTNLADFSTSARWGVLARSLGPDHPFTAKVRGNLAQVFRARERHIEAANLLLPRKF